MFELHHKNTHIQKLKPSVKLTKKGVYFNEAFSSKHFAGKFYIHFYFDNERKLIGFKPIAGHKPTAYKLRMARTGAASVLLHSIMNKIREKYAYPGPPYEATPIAEGDIWVIPKPPEKE